MSAAGGPAGAPDPQVRVNTGVWRDGSFVGAYAGRALRPPEVTLLVRYRDELAGRVLELGCGAGRVTGYFLQLGASVHAIDLSPRMVEHCRRRYPGGTFEVGDLRNLSGFGDASFDVVFAGYNVLDVLDDGERRRVLGEIHRILVDGGLLMMSTHNRAAAPSLRGPLAELLRAGPLGTARGLVRAPQRLRNRRRLLPLERAEADYAILNDGAHDYRLLHYYVDRDAQARQLAETGFEPRACIDAEGDTLAPGDTGAASPELHYVAVAV